MLKFTNIQVARVANGWIVLSDGVKRSGGTPDDAIVVKEGEDLGGAIAAALVSGKLKAADQPEEKVPEPYNIYPQQIYGQAATNSGLSGLMNAAALNQGPLPIQQIAKDKVELAEQSFLERAINSVRRF